MAVETCTIYGEVTVIVNWCYARVQALSLPEIDPIINDDNDNNARRTQVLKIYILAHQLGMPRLKNDLVDKFRQHSVARPIEVSLVQQMLDSLPEKFGMSRFIIDHLAFYMYRFPKEYGSVDDVWSKEVTGLIEGNNTLLRNFTRRQFAFQSAEKAPRPKSLCFYHDHVEGFECLDEESRIQAEAIATSKASSTMAGSPVRPHKRLASTTTTTTKSRPSPVLKAGVVRQDRETSKKGSIDADDGGEETDSDLASAPDTDDEE